MTREDMDIQAEMYRNIVDINIMQLTKLFSQIREDYLHERD